MVDDKNLAVQHILDFNKMVNDAKKDEVEMVYYPMDLSEPLILAVGDSSWANVTGPNETERIRSQAGYVILLADNRQGAFLKNSGGL
eukprot:7823490-Lingulodinium_polyedra.AAC.1